MHTHAGGQTTLSASSPTVDVGNGPFYVSNTAELTEWNLNYTDLPGERMRVGGRVFGGPQGTTLLVGAKLEIWHADAKGSYHPNSGGDAAAIGRENLALRGYVLTAPDGRYEIRSIYPGEYPGRCRHYHLRVSALEHRPVSTQLIFPALPGDVRSPENDSIARLLPPEHWLEPTSEDGAWAAEFDLRLATE